MSDNIDIPVHASGADGVDRLVSALDRLHASMEKLGTGGGSLGRLEQQMLQMQTSTLTAMQTMQATMRTGFAEMAALAGKGGEQVVAAKAKSDDALARLQERARDKQLNADRTFNQARQELGEKSAAASFQNFLTIEARKAREQERAATKAEAVAVRTAARQDAITERAAASSFQNFLSIENRKEQEQARLQAKAEAAALATAARQQRIEEQAAASSFKSFLDINRRKEQEQARADASKAAAQAKALADAERAAERQRVLNTNFQTAGTGTQLFTATRAQVYAQNGGNAVEKYGSAAASADINALRAAHERLQQTVPGSTRAVEAHGNAMREAHSLARGLAGSLGGLWLTYGSVAPLLAGATIAASLKNVVTAGKEVENQLNFVFALSEDRQNVDLNKFLAITDSSLSSVVESANAMRMLAQNGMQAGEALRTLPTLLDLAVVGEMQVGQAALAVTGAVSAFGLGVGQAGRVADIFAKTAAESNTSVVAITESMKQASTVASLFKVSIEETAGVLGTLAKINITGGAAGTAMTNMLTGLYEPTEKAKKALAVLGLETKTTSGALKPFTQVMEEMRMALSSFNDSAKVDILGSIFTTRGVKAAMQVQENLADYRQKVQEATTATGFMRGVVETLENSTTGAFTRMGVSIQNSYVRAFTEAGPYVQQLGLTLASIFKPGSTADTGLKNFATNVARMTSSLAENLNVVGMGVGAYLTYRMAIAPLIPLINTALTATAASTTATVAATAASTAAATANAVHATAISAGVATTATFTAAAAANTVAIEAQTAATVASTAAAAAWQAVLLPALGALALAVAAAAALWLVFRDNTTEADAGNVKISNSLHVIEDALRKEEERLERVIALWDERNARFGDDKSVSPKTIDAARAQVDAVEQLIRKSGKNPDDVRKNLQSTESRYNPQTGEWEQMVVRVSIYAEALEEADKNLKALQKAEQEYNNVVKPKQAYERLANDKDQLRKDIERFRGLGTETNSKDELVQQNAAIRDLYAKAGPLLDALKASPLPLDPLKIKPEQLEAEATRIAKLRVDLRQLNDEVNKMQGGRPAKVGSGLNMGLKDLQHEIDLQRLLSQSETFQARQQYARGEIGDIQLINAELEAKIALRQKEVEITGKQAALADAADKPAKVAAYNNKRDLAVKQDAYDRVEAQEKVNTALAKMRDDTTAAEAKSLADRGQLVDAFSMEFEAKYGETLRRVNADIFNSTDAGTKATLVSYRDMLVQMEADGAKAALGKQLEGQFKEGLSSLEQLVNRVENDAQGGSLGQVFESALAAVQALDAAMPGLIEKQRELQAQAVASGKPEDMTRANKALKEIDNAAARTRQVWLTVGESIGKSLGGAFDRAGKSVGKLVTAYTTYGAKQKEIRDNLVRDSAANPEKRIELEKKAAEDLSKLTVKSYGDMAGAAKGFFKEKTGAYRVLEATEKAFRAFELASEIKNFAVKSGLLEAFTGLFVTSKVAQTAAEGTQTAASTAMAGTQASAWGVTAVVKAIASMPFPYNLIAGAATLAAVVGIGAKVVGSIGGGGKTTAQERQEKVGTGSVLGDDKAKSESIKKSLERIESNTYQGLAISQGMLMSLRAIQAGIGAVGNILAQNGVSGNAPASVYGGMGRTMGNFTMGVATISDLVLTGGLGTIIDKLTGGWLGKITNKITGAIFGGKTTAEDIGITANKSSVGQALSGGLSALSYADMKKKGGWFSSDKYWTDTQGLGTEANRQFTAIIEGMVKTVSQAGVLLGVGGDAFNARLNAFVIDIGKISTKDLKLEEIQAQLEAAFSKVGDDMARWAVGDLTNFQQAGEGALETLVRLAQGYQTVDVVFQSMGKTFGQVGFASLAARQRLIDLSGGLEDFLSQSSYFLENFFTEAEQAAALQARVQPTLSKYGLSATGDDAMKKFRDYVVALDTTTQTGAEAYAALIALAPALKEIADVANDIADERQGLLDRWDDLMMSEAELRAKERAGLDASNRALYDAVIAAEAVATARDRLTEAYEAEQQALEQTVDRMEGLAKSWKEFRDNLIMGDNSTLTPQQKYLAAQAKYEETLLKARSGDTDAQDAYQSVAQAFLDASRVVNSSGAGYTRDFEGVLRATEENEVWARAQVDVAKASMDLLKEQVKHLIDIKQDVLSVTAAINNFAAAVSTAEYLKKLADAARVNQSSTTGTVDIGAPSTAAKLDQIVEELRGLRDQQAQENSDSIDANTDAALAAAEKAAQAARDAKTDRAWTQRNYATAR